MPRKPYALTESDFPHALAYFEKVAADFALEDPRKMKALRSSRENVVDLQKFIDEFLSPEERARMVAAIRKRRSRSSPTRSNADHRVLLDADAADLLRRTAERDSSNLSDTVRRYLPRKSPTE